VHHRQRHPYRTQGHVYLPLACVNGGLPHDTGALTVNRLCGSGFQAIVSAAQYILLGETDTAVAGGARA